MADFGTIDTSSYPKPTPGPSVLDTVGKLQGLEQQNIGIDQNKLNLVNSRYAIVSRELQGLMGEPDLDFTKVAGRFQNLVNLGLIPSQMMAQSLQDVPTDKAKIPQWLQMKVKQGQSIVDAINYSYGSPGTIDTGQALQPVRTSSQPGFGIRSGEGLPIQKQIPPTTPVINSNNEPTLQGPTPAQAAPGTVTAPPPIGPLPVGPRRLSDGSTMDVGPNTAPRPALPVAPAAPLSPAARVAQGFPPPSGPRTGQAPGVGEAQSATGIASGQQLAQDRTRAAAFQRDIFPLTQAIPALEKLGTKGTGPGTETINHLKSFALANVPGIKESDFDGTVADYDKAKKYLTDFVNQTGNSGTNDKLAAAFAGNPSVSISNAAAVDVAKSALALRRMQQAQLMEFENTGLPEHQYSKWLAKRTQELDPRAFGVDMMNENAKKKLLTQLNKNTKDKARFEQSLDVAHNLGFLEQQNQQ